MPLTKITKKGQITLPKEVRDKFKILPGDYLIIHIEGSKIILEPKGKIGRLRGAVKVKGKQNFKRITEKAMHDKSKDVIKEGK